MCVFKPYYLNKPQPILSEEVLVISLTQDAGQNIDRTHIQVLLKEMEDMDTSYAEMASMLNYLSKQCTASYEPSTLPPASPTNLDWSDYVGHACSKNCQFVCRIQLGKPRVECLGGKGASMGIQGVSKAPWDREHSYHISMYLKKLNALFQISSIKVWRHGSRQ